MNKRLRSAMLAYAFLGAVGFLLLHGTALYAVLAFFGWLAMRTLVAAKRTDR